MDLEKYFSSKKTQKKIADIKKKFGLEKLGEKLDGLLGQVIQGEIDPARLYEHLHELGIDYAQAVGARTAFLRDVFYVDEKKKLELGKRQEEYKKKTEEEIEEVREIAGIKEKGPRIKVEKIGVSEIAKEAAEKIGLTFETEVLKKRFEDMVSAFLRDVRDERETKETLIHSEKIGGMGLSEPQADEIVDFLRISKPKVEIVERKKMIVPPKEIEWAPEPPKPEEYKKMLWRVERTPVMAEKETAKKVPVHEAPPKPPEPLSPEKKPQLKVGPPLAEEPQVPSKPPSPSPIIPSPPLEPPKESPKEELPPTPYPLRPKIIGPVEELKSLTLEDFRRWSADPKESASKIKQKIDLLEKESLTKKAEGIKSWKESEIYQVYLDLGRESLEKGMPIEEVIKTRSTEGKPTLTIEEFKVITNLNQKLRF